jgi:hypothetical protein
MSAAILTPKGVYIAPIDSLRPQAAQIGPPSRQQEQPRETPKLNFT